MSKFNWRRIADAPREGTEIIAMQVVTHVGGWSRPIDITPDLVRVSWAGYWRTRHQSSVYLRDNNWWTTPDEYAAAIPAAEWRVAPRSAPEIICCPLVFVRPVEPRSISDYVTDPCYEADVVWSDGDHLPVAWHRVRSYEPLRPCHPGFLDGENVLAHPFRWCWLADFFPDAVFDDMVEGHRRACDYRVQNVEQLRRQATRDAKR